MSTTIRLRSLLRFTIFLACWLHAQQSVLAAQNVTILDTDPSIDYQPPESWQSSTTLCSTCLNPGTSTSFHEAIHPPTGNDADDHHDASDPDRESESRKSSDKKTSRRSFVKPVIPRVDADDAGFVDPPVSMAVNFTGTAVYLFATQPPNLMNVNNTSSNMNLTFSVDNMLTSTVLSTSPSNSNYLSGQLVFSQVGLTDGPHELLVQVGQNSTFIFESLIYTTEAQNISSTTPQSSPSPSVDPMAKKHNIATFGAAVGGSAGVLALFSLGLAFSIIRRRHLAALRERRDHESLHTNASDDSPPMFGPAPFIPRYFPDTVIPTEPPTYMAALATNAHNSTLLAVLSPEAFGTATRSYADIPPSVPPPPLEDTLMLPPPPPFPVAISTPPPPMIESPSEEGAPRPPIVGTSQSSHSAISSVVVDTRPRSRASTRSTDSTSSSTKPTDITNLRQDVA